MLPNKMHMKLKENLKVIMEQRALSATQLAKLSKIRKQRISDWLAGASPKDIDQVKAVAMALQVSLDELMFGSSSDADTVDQYLESVPEDSEIVFQVKVKRLRTKE